MSNVTPLPGARDEPLELDGTEEWLSTEPQLRMPDYDAGDSGPT